jgi:hypothetical protein
MRTIDTITRLGKAELRSVKEWRLIDVILAAGVMLWVILQYLSVRPII